MDVGIDWYSATFLSSPVEEVVGYMNRFVDGWEVGNGHHGYSVGKRGNGVTVYYAGREGMGTHLQISGEGCNWVSTCPEWSTWAGFCTALREIGADEKRFDIAFDERSGICTVDVVRQALEAGEFCSDWHEWQTHRSQNRGGVSGEAVYIGSASSDSCLVVYDKILERRAAGVEVEGAWVRFELRYKHVKAKAFADWLIARGGLSDALGLLSGCVKFTVPSIDTNVTRRRSARWWEEIVGGACAERLEVRAKGVDFQREVMAFSKQHGRTLAMLNMAGEAAGVPLPVVEHVLSDGACSLRTKHVKRLQLLIQSAQTQELISADRDREVGS